MRRLSIFVAGVQKGGTTSLHACMARHPQLRGALRKELHYFDDESRDWASGEYGDLAAMLGDDDGRMPFDATPIYGFWGPSLARIKAYNPAARLIFIYRDPVARAYSHWCMEVARGAEVLPFARAIREGRRRMDDDPLSGEARVFSYVERGFYGAQLTRALALFPAEQMLLLRLEDFAEDQAATLARVANFLRLAPFPQMPPVHEHRAMGHDWGAPSKADRDWLMAQWGADLVEFARASGLDIAHWGRSELQAQPG